MCRVRGGSVNHCCLPFQSQFLRLTLLELNQPEPREIPLEPTMTAYYLWKINLSTLEQHGAGDFPNDYN